MKVRKLLNAPLAHACGAIGGLRDPGVGSGWREIGKKMLVILGDPSVASSDPLAFADFPGVLAVSGLDVRIGLLDWSAVVLLELLEELLELFEGALLDELFGPLLYEPLELVLFASPLGISIWFRTCGQSL